MFYRWYTKSKSGAHVRQLVKTLVLAIISVSCQGDRGVVEDNTNATADANKDTRRFHPYSIVFNIGDPYLAELADTGQNVPKIQVTLDEDIPNHFYQVQRCHNVLANKIVDQYDNDPLTQDYPTYKTVTAHLFAWGNASIKGCVFLGRAHRQAVFEDYTAPSGKFFYLFRPCLGPVHSQFGRRRNCHYLYRKTGVIDYTDTFGQTQWRLRLELAAMRSKLQAQFTQLSETIIHKANFLEVCESNEARRCVLKARFAGISKIVLTAAVATTATILSGGTTAVVAGGAAIKLADKVFSSASNCSLQCDTSVFDKRIIELQEGVNPIASAIQDKLGALENN